MTELQRIGLFYGTDKSDANHSFHGVSYLDEYDALFHKRRHQIKTVLELGVLQGRSLKTWRDYFSNAYVWGVDIDPKANADYGPRIQVVTGSQTDPAVLAAANHGNDFDVVIDDGSHLVEHIIASFNLLWPRLVSGGFYIIEDVALSYIDVSASVKEWPGQHLNAPDTNFKNNRALFDNLLRDLIRTMDKREGDTVAVRFYSNLCILEHA